MATEEIEISELEFTEELASDNLIPVESSTDTKATSLQKIKDWLSSFFVGKTGNETIRGDKTFTGNVNFDSSTYTGKQNGFIYQTSLGDFSVGVRESSGAWLNAIRITPSGNINLVLPPESNSNSNDVVTTKWVRENSLNALNTLLQGTEGSIVLNNGVTIQWGYVLTSETEIVFPTPFNTTNYTVVANPYYNASGNISTIEYTTTGCKLVKSRSDFSVKWFAIGR